MAAWKASDINSSTAEPQLLSNDGRSRYFTLRSALIMLQVLTSMYAHGIHILTAVLQNCYLLFCQSTYTYVITVIVTIWWGRAGLCYDLVSSEPSHACCEIQPLAELLECLSQFSLFHLSPCLGKALCQFHDSRPFASGHFLDSFCKPHCFHLLCHCNSDYWICLGNRSPDHLCLPY